MRMLKPKCQMSTISSNTVSDAGGSAVNVDLSASSGATLQAAPTVQGNSLDQAPGATEPGIDVRAWGWSWSTLDLGGGPTIANNTANTNGGVVALYKYISNYGILRRNNIGNNTGSIAGNPMD